MSNFDQAMYNPSLMYESRDSQSWTANGNTHTVTDSDVRAGSFIVIMHTSAPAGKWYITPSAGSFLITSSDAETATTTTFKYIIL